jgi:hypothetical protein
VKLFAAIRPYVVKASVAAAAVVDAVTASVVEAVDTFNEDLDRRAGEHEKRRRNSEDGAGEEPKNRA